MTSVAVLAEISLKVTPKIIYLYYQKIYLQDQSFQNKLNNIFEKKITAYDWLTFQHFQKPVHIQTMWCFYMTRKTGYKSLGF